MHIYAGLFEKLQTENKKVKPPLLPLVKVFPGGINHNIRYFKPYPFFVNGAKAQQLIDVDGNKYTDYWMGH